MRILPAVDMYGFPWPPSTPQVTIVARNGSQSTTFLYITGASTPRPRSRPSAISSPSSGRSWPPSPLSGTYARMWPSGSRLGRACSLWSVTWLGALATVGSRGSYTGHGARSRSSRPTPICSTAGRSCCTPCSTTRACPSCSSCWSPCGVCRNCASSGNPYASYTLTFLGFMYSRSSTFLPLGQRRDQPAAHPGGHRYQRADRHPAPRAHRPYRDHALAGAFIPQQTGQGTPTLPPCGTTHTNTANIYYSYYIRRVSRSGVAFAWGSRSSG